MPAISGFTCNIRCCLALTFFAWIAVPWITVPLSVLGQDTANKPGAAAGTKSVTALQEAIQHDVSLSGSFIARQVHEISVAAKKFQPLTILQIAGHGQRVRKGDVVLKLDTTKLDEMIADQLNVVALSNLSLKEAEEQLKVAVERAPLTKQQSALTKQYADEDFKRFQEVDHPFALRAAEQNLRMAKQFLEYTEEELKQLEQMYKADDLTEQTEEIILRRARNEVDRSRFAFEQSQKEHERTTTFTLPRNERQQQYTHRLAELAYQTAVISQSTEVNKQTIAVEKTRVEHERAKKLLAALQQDRKLMVVKAPIGGIVYFGRATDGKWPAVAEMAKRLRPHGTLSPFEEVMSIVDNESLEFSGKVAEVDLVKLRQGVSGRLTPTSRPKDRLTARVKRIDEIPIADGQFQVIVDVDTTPQHQLVAGMTGIAKFTTYVNNKAVTVPVKTVFAEPSDDTRKFVYVLGSNGRSERRECTTGITVGDRIEILTGVVAGEQLLEEKPAP